MSNNPLLQSLINGEWLTVDEAAEIVGITPFSVRRWIRNGDLPSMLIGSRKEGYRIRTSDLEAFVAKRYTGNPAQEQPTVTA